LFELGLNNSVKVIWLTHSNQQWLCLPIHKTPAKKNMHAAVCNKIRHEMLNTSNKKILRPFVCVKYLGDTITTQHIVSQIKLYFMAW